MNKRILSLCLALVLLLCLLPAAAPTAAAAGDVVINATNFPDANFRSYVSGKCDPDGDGVLSPAEISDVTEIWCSECGIASLKGIEFFTALETLNCDNNQLTALDVSRNTALKELWCSGNRLKSLDVSKNTALKELFCGGNQLTSLDVSRNTALNGLSCRNNQLTSLDVSRNTALNGLLCFENQLTSLDVSKNTALTELYCSDNQLTSLDVSRNTALSSLSCGFNQLKSLDVSKNTALTELSCFDNQLTSLDVSKNTALTALSCSNNQLTALDVSRNQKLWCLRCYGNALTVLDVSAVPILLDALENGNWTVEDGHVVYKSDEGHLEMDLNQKTVPETSFPAIIINETNFPDANFRSYVSGKCDPDGDGVLSPAEISNVTEIWCSECGIASLKGIEYFTALKSLNCDNNQLTALDVSKNTALNGLYCSDNQLTALDVSKNTALEYLSCYNNQLTSLDVSKNTALEMLWCSVNPLTALDVSKNTALVYLYCSGNQLTSLDVSKNTALKELDCSDNPLTALDVSKNTALEWLRCYNNQLTSLDVSKNTALEHLYCDYNQLTSLDVSRNTALDYLNCSGNKLTSLDVSKNTALEWLSCSDNSLTALDVRKNTALEYLSCYGNKLTVLDVSAVPNLLDALENGEKTVNKAEGFVEYESEQGHIWMDLGQKTIPVTNCFSDVGSDDFFYDAVLWAYQNDITAGTSKTKFSPAKTCTREQVVTFLWRAKGCPEPTGTNNPFKDVPADAYYAKAVLWAVENGITNGKSKTKFGVGDACTRGQVVTFLWRAEGEPEPTSAANPFKDVSETDYFYKAVLWAVEKGITKGTSKTKFSPAKTCTRGQVVTFLYRDVVGEQ